jgi:hypothetical protein
MALNRLGVSHGPNRLELIPMVLTEYRGRSAHSAEQSTAGELSMVLNRVQLEICSWCRTDYRWRAVHGAEQITVGDMSMVLNRLELEICPWC